MGMIGDTVKNTTQEYTPLQKQLKRTADLNEELERAKDKALNSEGVMVFQRRLSDFFIQIKIAFYKFIGDITNSYSSLYNNIFDLGTLIKRVFVDFINKIPIALKNMFTSMVDDVKALSEVFSRFGGLLKSIFTFDSDAIKKSFDDFTNQAKNAFSKTKKASKELGNVFSDSVSESVKGVLKERQERQNGAKQELKAEHQTKRNQTKPTDTQTEDQLKKAAEARKKKADDLKKEAEKKKKEAEQKAAEELKRKQSESKAAIDLLKEELAAYIDTNKSKIENQKLLTQRLINEEKQRLETIFAYKQKMAQKEHALELMNGKLSQKERDAINAKYKNQEIKQLKQHKDSLQKVDESYQKQSDEFENFHRLTKQKQALIDLEQQGAASFEIKQKQLEIEEENNQEKKQLKKELETLEKQEQKQEEAELDEAFLMRKADIEMRLSQISEEYAQKRMEVQLQEQSARLELSASVAGAIAQIAGQETIVGKAAAIAQATINTYMGFTSALAAPFPINTIQPPLILAAGLAQVAKIAGVNVGGAQEGFSQLGKLAGGSAAKASGKRKAERGMILEGPSHNQGGINLYDDLGRHVVEAEGGELLAIINKRSTRLLEGLSFANQAGGGIPLTHFVNHAQRGGLVRNPSEKAMPSINIDIGKDVGRAAYKGIQQGMAGLYESRKVLGGAEV